MGAAELAAACLSVPVHLIYFSHPLRTSRLSIILALLENPCANTLEAIE